MRRGEARMKLFPIQKEDGSLTQIDIVEKKKKNSQIFEQLQDHVYFNSWANHDAIYC